MPSVPGSARAAVAARFEGLPGWEIVSAGLADLAEERTSVESLLVQSVSLRLGQLGVRVPPTTLGDPDAALYELVVAEVGEGRAHGRYNALRRRLAKFLRAASTQEAVRDAASD